MLRISRSLGLPDDAVTQTFGILAVRGAGKTNTAVVMAEEMYDARLPFVVVDPVGVWWGLRSASDGKAKGLAIPVFGGRHADVPLERGAGQHIADVVVDKRLTCVLDVSEFSETDKVRFLRDFAERLYRRNSAPLHLFLEEADDYVPQKPFREQAHLLRAWENIVRRGRSRGLGITMITQRSAALNKNVLTQIETLITMRTTSPNDRKAIAGWVDYHGLGKEMLESLPSLETGEAWLWSPSWLQRFEKVRIRKRRTFDSSQTPKGRTSAAARMADIDLSELEREMKEAIERAKETDPRELKARVQQLERELSAALAQVPEPEVERVEFPVLSEEDKHSLQLMLQEMHRNTQEFKGTVEKALTLADEVTAKWLPVGDTRASGNPVTTTGGTYVVGDASGNRDQRRADGSSESDASLSRPKQAILNALARFEVVKVLSPSRNAVAALAGASSKSSAFLNNVSSLRVAGLIDYPWKGHLTLTDAGRALAEVPDAPLSELELQESIYDMVKGARAKLLRAIVEAAPNSLTREELASRTGYSPISSAFLNNVSSLRSWGFIDYPVKGSVVATDLMFIRR